MANRERGEMELVAGASTYVLRLTTNACCDLEDRSGRLIDQVFAGATRGSVRDLRWLLWASLQDRHGDTIKTPQDAGAIIDAAGGLHGVVKQMETFMALNQQPESDEPPQERATSDPPVAQVEPGGDASISRLAVSA